MITLDHPLGLNLVPDTLRQLFNQEPFGFQHSLSGLDLFRSESLQALAEKYIGHKVDYYVATGAPKPETIFFAVPLAPYQPHEALRHLDSGAYRVLLKRPEKFDSRFRDLINHLSAQVVDLLGGLGNDRIVRLEGGLLITSAATTTPFHFDPEIGFFSQIEGEKIYHVFSPRALSEPELERFYRSGRVSIATVDLAGRDPSCEHVFVLQPGFGLHQPQNAAHWVETRRSRSISYTFVFETESGRAQARTRAFNHYQRRLRLNPSRPGAHPAVDAVKSSAMRMVLPVRKGIADIVRASRSH